MVAVRYVAVNVVHSFMLHYFLMVLELSVEDEVYLGLRDLLLLCCECL